MTGIEAVKNAVGFRLWISGLDVRGCGSDIDNRPDRSSAYSILRGKLGSGIDDN